MNIISSEITGLKNIIKEINNIKTTNINKKEIAIIKEKLDFFSNFEYTKLSVNPTKQDYIKNLILNNITINEIDKYIEYIELVENKYLYENITEEEKKWWNNFSKFWEETLTKQIGFNWVWDEEMTLHYNYQDLDSFIINKIRNIKEIKVEILNDNKNCNLSPLLELTKLKKLHLSYDFDDFLIDYKTLEKLNIEDLRINVPGLTGISLKDIGNINNLKNFECDWIYIEDIKDLSCFKKVEKLKLKCVTIDFELYPNWENDLNIELRKLYNLKELEFYIITKVPKINLSTFSNLNISKLYIVKNEYSETEIINFKQNNPFCILFDNQFKKEV